MVQEIKRSSTPVPTAPILVVAEWVGGVDIDVCACLLAENGKVRADTDLIFYNQPDSADGSVRCTGRAATEAGTEERLAIHVDALAEDVEAVAVAISVEGAEALSTPVTVTWRVLDAQGATLTTADGIPPVAGGLILGLLQRSPEGWSWTHSGDLVAEGLVEVATRFGVDVEDDASEPVEAGASAEETEPLESTDLGSPLPEYSSSEPPADDPLVTDDVTEEPAVDAVLVSLASTALDEPLPGVPQPVGVPTAPTVPVRQRQVRAVGSKVVKARPPELKLAGGDDWVAARLFSISGVGNAGEQEKRATSALMATAMGVRAFGRGLTALAAAPAGNVETYLEVQFDLNGVKVIPDAVIRVARGSRSWTALLEVKTDKGQLRTEQVESYLEVAKAQGFDAVITLSNEIAPGAGEHPVPVDKRKLRKVSLVHLSWAEVLHEAQMTLTHRGVSDAVQAWVLHELIRYLQHPRSGASGFQDMGAEWVPVREAVAAGTLRAADSRGVAVTESWNRLVRHLCLRLTVELGVQVGIVQPRKLPDARGRTTTAVSALAEEGRLSATVKVPGAAGPVQVIADLRTGQVRTSVQLSAPREGGSQRRISWLLRQIPDAPDDILIEVGFPGRAADSRALLRDARASSSVLLQDAKSEVLSFRLTRTSPLGTKRSGVKGAFIPSVEDAIETFYKDVVQPLRAWVPPAPKLPEEPEEIAG